jgi:endonuclease-8
LPEGDTVAQVARLLRPHLVGQTLTAVQARRLDTGHLVGARVTACESTGKYLNIACDQALTLRSHLGLHGGWHGYAPGEAWQRPAWQASLVLATEARVLVCFNARSVEILATQGWRQRDARLRLGPDPSPHTYIVFGHTF